MFPHGRIARAQRVGWIVLAFLTAALLLKSNQAFGQDVQSEFDVASIKPSAPGTDSGVQTLADGTVRLRGVRLAVLLALAAPASIASTNIVGFPEWTTTELYDVVVRPPTGTTQEQMRPMWFNVLTTRMKLAAHVEQREGKAFDLVLARRDGRLGPNLKKSTLDCTTPSPTSTPSPGQAPPDFTQRCGMGGTGTRTGMYLISGGTTMDMLAQNLAGRAGGAVENRTGLDGYYAFTLNFAPPSQTGGPAPAFDLPDFFTALQEQLGLKLQPAKKSVPFWVIDRIERPTED